MIETWHLGFVVLGYLLGAIPFGLLVGLLTKGVDVRQYGSGNIGAANVQRVLGWRASALVFLADLSKAALPVIAARLATGSPIIEVLTGVAAITGHNWSIYLRGRGGRGVSSAFGLVLVVSPPAGLLALALFVGLVAWTRYVSLGSIVGAVAGAVLLVVHVIVGPLPWVYVVYALVITPIIVFQHRGNIQRLLAGTERKMGERAL